MKNFLRALAGRPPAGRHRRPQHVRAATKAVSTVAAATLIFTGLTLPSFAASADEPVTNTTAEAIATPETPVDDQQAAAETPAEEAPAEAAPAPEPATAEVPPIAQEPGTLNDARAGPEVAPDAAPAAGAGVLSITVTPVNYLTGDPITETAYNQNDNRVGYRVAYSCSVADCTNAKVAFTPSQADPYGLGISSPPAYGPTTLLSYETWTRPNGVPDIAPTGDDVTGKTFSLGTLAAGASGTFLVTYVVPATGTYTTARAAQFYPDGFQIQMGATATSDTAVAPVTADAAPVTWHIKTPAPSISATTSIPVVRPDSDMIVRVAMGSGSFPDRGDGNITGTSEWIAAGSYTVKQILPPEAEVVTIPDGGVYDAATHSITWTRGTTAAPDYLAAGGWGSTKLTGWSNRNAYFIRPVTLKFPAANFPEADANGCNFERALTTTVETSVTYLDQARTTKTASDSRAITVSCYDPFGVSAAVKDVNNNHGTDAGSRIVRVPNAGAPVNTYGWDVTARNGGNVPGVAVIEDNTLDQANAPVHRIELSAAGTIEWKLNTGQTGTTNGTFVNAPAGTRFVSAKVTSGQVNAVRVRPSDTGWADFRARFVFTVADSAPVGQTRENTATSKMSWPSNPELAAEDRTAVRSIKFATTPPIVTPPRITAAFPTPAAVEGGGTAVPGRNVTFTVGGTTQFVPTDSNFTPEYVFIAPAGWEIVDGSAAFAGAVPDGVTVTAATRTVGGVERQVLVASWPTGTDFDSVATLPQMTVIAKPTFAVAAGTTSVANVWIGDSERNWTNTEAVYAVPKQNSEDVDGSGDTSAWFSTAVQNVVVSSADSITVTKEICRPDADAADGCDWIADPGQIVPVPLSASSIKYRISLQNTGNTTLGSVLAYDVLPYVGDTGLTTGTAGTPRGSTFEEFLTDVTSVSSNLTLTYSPSKNPARPEVNPSSGGVNDWAAGAAGKRAIRAQVNGSLAPGQVATFAYEASVGAGSAADAKACNSVAISTNRTLPSEPQPVCATTAEADVEARGPDTIEAQLGRPTVFPFVFENLGGSQSAPATVKIDIPSGVTVTDLASSGWTCTAGSDVAPITGPATLDCTPPENLAKGAPVDFDLATIVTADGVAVTATITGTMHDAEEGNNSHTITVPNAVAAATGLTVAKTDGVTAVTVGQESTYTLSVTNPLEFEQLVGATVSDTLPAGTEFVSASNGGVHSAGVVTWSLDLAAAASVDVTVTVRVLDGAANSIVNTATATATDPAFPAETLTGTGSDTDAVDRITLTKTGAIANAATPKPGDTVTYTFVATNNGGGVLSAVEITDAMAGLSDITITSWPALPGFLGVGQSVTGTATYTLTQADVDAGTVSNTATVTGSSAGGSAVTATATEDITLPSAPAILVQKDGSIAAGTPKAGDLVTYTFTVSNPGNVTLIDVGITDPMAGLSTITYGTWPGTANQLAAGQSVTATATYALTQADIDAGKVDNTATGSGGTPTGALVTSTDGATVTLVQNAALSIEKTGALPDPENVAAGDTITYTFTAVNTGNVTLTGVTIADPLAGLSPLNYSWPTTTAGVLAPGQTVTATATFVTGQEHIDAGKVDNTATATGSGPSGNASATDATTVSLLADAELSLVKTATVAAGDPKAGDTVTYTFEAENTGNVTISSVEIDDQLEGLSTISYGAWPGADGVLKRGEKVTATATYTLTQADIDAGTVDNTATAAGEAPNGDDVSATDAATVSLTAAPAITLVKDGSIAAGTPKAGDKVSYTFEAENTGNVTLLGVDITDQLAGLSDVEFGAWPAADGVLAPGKKVTATASYELTQADLDAGTVVNLATVDAAGARGGDVTAEDGVTVDLPAAPALELVKDAKLADASGTPKAGDTVTFAFEARNTGNVTVAGVNLLDTMTGLSAISYGAWPAADGVLAPGEKVTATASYTLTQADLDGGSVFNDATVSGAPARGDLDDAGDSAIVELPAAPALAFTKTGTAIDAERPLADQLVTFEFEIENTGNVTVDGIAITDELDGLSDVVFGTWPNADGVLAPGEKVTASATYPLTQADVDAGSLLNEATVAGTPARGDALEVPAEVTVELPALPGLSIVKTAALTDTNGDGFANPGEKITYSFKVENTGNVTMHDVVVNDAKVTGIPEIAEIAPGETVTVKAVEYTVTTAEAATGAVVNTATATGAAPDGPVITADESSVTTKAAIIPGAPIVKDGLAHSGFTGTNIALLSALMVLAGAALMMFVLIRRRQEGAKTE